MNLYLVPASKENLAATIYSNVPLDTLNDIIPPHEQAQISKLQEIRDGFHCWAFPQGKASNWHNMQVGDIVLITPKQTGKFQIAARAIYKLQSEMLGNKLWPFVPGEPWKHIYLLATPINIDLDKRTFLTQVCGYNPNFVVPGSIRVKDKHIKQLLSKYKTLENFWMGLTGESTSFSKVGDLFTPVTMPSSNDVKQQVYLEPKHLKHVISYIKELMKDTENKERGHEALVERFFEALGYSPVSEIKFRQGHVDIQIQVNGTPKAIIEVKRNWSLTRHDVKVLKQAFGYAGEHGVRTVIISNGDYYAIFDRNLPGLHYDDSFIGEFRLTRLTEECLQFIDWLKGMRHESS